MHAGRPALEVDGEVWTYARLREKVLALAATLQRWTPTGGAHLVSVFGHRSSTGFAGILAALSSGRGYVPLNRTFPIARTRAMFEAADCRAMIVDHASSAQLDEILVRAVHPLLVIVDRNDASELAARWPEHMFRSAQALEPAGGWVREDPASDAIAYLLFTSGSTGPPKGVPVTHGNASHFVATAVERYDVRAEDRFSQMFDATFDLSVFDMFVPWSVGACVCCPHERARMNADAFIKDSKPTIWLSVPSVGMFMKRLGMLKPNRYPSLRWSLFCGEPLPVAVARAWAGAAPASTVENLYGPTEATVACAAYRWDGDRSLPDAGQDIVPIGEPLPGTRLLVVDELLQEVPPGVVGELLIGGPQVTPGYWRNDEATARAYVSDPECGAAFYRTGDRVRRVGVGGPLAFVGRIDDQVKILGHRVELGEVECRLREAPGVSAAAALAWPVTSAGAAGIAAFVVGVDADPAVIRASVQAALPQYAVPRAIHVLSDLPRNANGKVDRSALVKLLDQASLERSSDGAAHG